MCGWSASACRVRSSASSSRRAPSRMARWWPRSSSTSGSCSRSSGRDGPRSPRPDMYRYDEIDQRLVDERVRQFRNVTTEHFAGVARDEHIDSFVWCEIIRQWSTFHPEFSFLPRKFKIALNGARSDRAAVAVHDIGLHAVRDERGEVGFKVLVGGGLGRTPMIGVVIREFLPWRHLLTYVEAILRVYNRYGRRDNIHKARIKILVKERGADKFREDVEAEWAQVKHGPATLIPEEVERIAARFTRPAYEHLSDLDL